MDYHALILNSKKGKGNYGPTPTQNNAKTLIDYILVNKYISTALNCEAYFSFEGVSSDISHPKSVIFSDSS